MKTSTRCFLVAAMVLVGVQVRADEESGFLWISAGGNSTAAKASKSSADADAATTELPAETPKKPVSQWKAPVRKPAGNTAAGSGTATGQAPAGPRRLPEDPGYAPPRPRATPAPAAEPRGAGKSSQPEGAAKSPATGLTPSVSPADRSPCDWCGDCACQGTCAAALRTRACEAGNEPSEDAADGPWRLFDRPALTSRGFRIRGWVDQGITTGGYLPADRFNGPVTFNDRAGEYGMNQLYLITERATQTEGQGFDVGGRVDLLYGTDARFTTANGLDDTWIDGNRFYGMAMPQLYADFALNDWIFRVGHFYANVGYEVVPAVDNFFYSHTYTHQYGEPFTYTGAMAQWQFNDRLSLVAGFHRGWDQWEDNNQELGFLGGLNWKNEETGTSIAFGITASNEQVDQSSSLTMYSIVLTQKLGQRWRWVLQHDGAHESNVQIDGTDVGAANWFGVVNYLVFDLNSQWSFGLRYEWFSDNDGTRVRAAGYPHRIDFQPDPPFGAYWNDISVGFNYRPHRNVTLRSEGRWDWVGPVGTSSVYPFDDQSRGNQFLFAADLIIQF